jgi:hypothetical protein
VTALNGSQPERVRPDQTTIMTLEQAMRAARIAAERCLTHAGFQHVSVVVNAVATSLDPDDDITTWAAGTRVPTCPKPDLNLLAATLRESALEAETA